MRSARSTSRPAGALARWRRGLIALERHPLNVRLGVRGAVGMMVPLVLAQALGWPALGVVAFTAFLIAFGDVTEATGWLRRLVVASVFAALSAAVGALVGGHPVTAIVGMFVCGGAIGLAGVYGDAAAGMSLTVAWLFIEVGLPATLHTPAEAARLGLLVLGGGVWAIALAWATRSIEPARPLAAVTARSFAVLADYLDRVLAPDTLGAPSAKDYERSPETRVRASIAEARFLAVELRRRRTSTSPAGQRLVVLIELADQIFSGGALLAEARGARARDRGLVDGALASDVHPVLVAASRAVSRALGGHADGDAVARIEADLGRFGAFAPSSSPPAGAARDADLAEIVTRVAVASRHALHLAGGHAARDDAMERGVDALESPATGPSPEGRARSLGDRLRPLREALDTRSVVGRHALRYACVTAAAVAIDLWLDTPFGFWVPVTATVVLKPYAGSTLTRAGQRVGGTIAGVAVGVLLLEVSAPTPLRVAVIGAAFFAALATTPVNYGLAVFFLSAGVVPFEAFLAGPASGEAGMLRVVYTCIGGALALVGGWMLWPSFERRSLPMLLSAALSSVARYADRVLSAMGGPSSRALIEPAHRAAGLDNTNLQVSFERVAAEPGESRERLEAMLLAVVTLQRLLNGLNVLSGVGPDVATPPAWTRLQELVGCALADLPSALLSPSPPAPPPDIAIVARELSRELMARGAPYDRLAAWEVERLAWQVGALRNAVGRIGARAAG